MGDGRWLTRHWDAILLGAVTTALAGFTLLVGTGLAFAATPNAPAVTHAPQRPVCPGPVSAGTTQCHAHVITDRRGTPRATSAPTGYGPAQFHSAYSLPTQAPSAQTIAIVDAYDDPTIASDLNQYSSHYGLPQCTSTN